MNTDCPTIVENISTFCSSINHKYNNTTIYHPLVYGEGPAIASLVSCSLSIFGSLITILPYVLWKDIRTGIRSIITFLAVADLFTASGYMMGNVNYYVYKHRFHNSEACVKFNEFCHIQSYISSWSSYSSFWWTSILALYLYWTVVKGEIKKGDRYFPVYHILSWGSPILVMLPLLATGSLGYSIVAAGGWCFIRDDVDNGHINLFTTFKILVGGKAFEMGTYIWVIVVYGGIWCNIHRKKRKQFDTQLNAGISSLLKQVERKLYLIPIAFIFVRMWGTLQFFVSLFVFNLDMVKKQGCVSIELFHLYYALAILQSVGDGAQGWINSILYIFWSPKIRQRLILGPLASCCYRLATHITPTTNLPHTLSPVTSSPLSKKDYGYGIQGPPSISADHRTDKGLVREEGHSVATHDTLMETLSRDNSRHSLTGSTARGLQASDKT